MRWHSLLIRMKGAGSFAGREEVAEKNGVEKIFYILRSHANKHEIGRGQYKHLYKTWRGGLHVQNVHV